jgi:PST family polysaccharide transporter
VTGIDTEGAGAKLGSGARRRARTSDKDRRSLTHRTIDGLFWSALATSANVILQLAVVAVLARILTPRDFGTLAAATAAIGLSTIVANLGVAPAIIQRRELTSAHIETAFTMSCAMGLIMGGVFFACAPLMADFYRMPQLTNILRILSLVFPMSSVGLVPGALLSREMRFRRIAIRNTLSYLLGYGGVSITLSLLGFGVWALVLGQLVQTSIQTWQTIMLAGQPLRFGWERQARRDLLGYGINFTLGRFGNYAANQFDNIIVGRVLGPIALGYYSRAYQFISMPANLFGTVTDSVLFPAMSVVQDDRSKLERAYRQSLATIALTTLPVSGLLFVAAPEAVGVLLGDHWAAVIVPFRVLVVSLLFRTSYKMSDSLARASAATLNRAWRQWFYAASVIGGALLGTHYGIFGVAVGVSLAIIVNFFLMLQLSIAISGVSPQTLLIIHLRHLLVAVFTTSAAFLTITAARTFALPELARLAAASAAAAITWLLILWLVPALLGEELVWLVGILKNRIAPCRSARRGRDLIF